MSIYYVSANGNDSNDGCTGNWTVTTDLSVGRNVTAGVWQATKIGLAYGGTNADLSATGGAHQVVFQTSVGAAFTVATLKIPDLPPAMIWAAALQNV